MTIVAPAIGVEEEFFLVDPTTRAPKAAGHHVVARAAATLGQHVSCEFSRSQIEVKTPPCDDAAQLRREVLSLRRGAGTASACEGLRLCASGTAVLGGPEAVQVGDHPRYHAGLDQYRAMLDDFAVCAAHVHIHVPDRELAVLAGVDIPPA